MIFSSLEYFIFFAVVLLLMIFIRANSFKKAILIGASYYFYAYWDYRFLALMLVLTGVNYYAGLKIETSKENKEKNQWLIACIIFDLCVLGLFKYLNFFIDSANFIFNPLNIHIPLLNIILPIGISFITFEVMSYTIDIYRGINKSAKSFWDFALLVAFFPHLIAGPILKPKQFLPEIQHDIIIRRENVSHGLQLFLLGLVRKLLIADNLALFVDPVFEHPLDYSAITLWFAVIAYAMQIYCDFCGYTDMAIGSAKCLGFDIPKNFDIPYISQSITEFWRRWHISLSTWLRDYLYIPLGGNRKGKQRQYINLLITMLLGGLWHGASWNFVAWGGLHGIALAIHKIYMDNVAKKYSIKSFVYKLLNWLITLIFVCITWIFFRANNFSVSLAILKKMFYLSSPVGISWFATSLFLCVPLLILIDFCGSKLSQGLKLKLTTLQGWFVVFFAILGLIFAGPHSSSPFIYFQF
jgi:alginate O-acetyltransferase complex protein AlgI